LSRQKYGRRRACPIHLTGTLQIQPISYVLGGFAFSTVLTQICMVPDLSVIDLYLIAVGYRF